MTHQRRGESELRSDIYGKKAAEATTKRAAAPTLLETAAPVGDAFGDSVGLMDTVEGVGAILVGEEAGGIFTKGARAGAIIGAFIGGAIGDWCCKKKKEKKKSDDMSEEGEGEATLRNHRCVWKSWPVKVKGFCFTDGWGDFVRDNHIRLGYFLVFRYEGAMVFDVIVFNHSCCEKDYSSHPSKPPEAIKKEAQEQENDDSQATEEEIKSKFAMGNTRVAFDWRLRGLRKRKTQAIRIAMPRRFLVF